MCVAERQQVFTSVRIVQVFIRFLEKVAEKHDFRAIYCFMPEHLHLIALGFGDASDVLRGAEDFKQRSGYWFSSRFLASSWQKSFHDRIIREKELGSQVRYVLDNPVRRGLVREWREYQFTGAIGMDLETFLQEIS